MATKKPKKKPAKEEMVLQLDGHVYVKFDGTREEIDGKLVLECLVYCLREGLRLREQDAQQD